LVEHREFHDERGRYEIHGVMGPDEFHDGYPDSAAAGLNNNA
jgi:trehalose/maltose hydrolase-like predicted phosphorylase